ncbi:hypothetical protein CPHO_12095 [Corynebacterium phocae]|uniref:Schlafen AlbA-2 domain-containing protein n=1 Tax=Corynebacterium phocae TaxID=161895 RepID=A0A1L7D6T4_9CORY|nr:ATP-binding protein [Corynebacterium phocae]APT93815.1 hypothetical protein CPHO_12095 [Corynebacterium phocae]KAA8720591.1 AAA family ATPase [Corynebacterium phocae]
MTTFSDRIPDYVKSALSDVYEGATADSVESAILEFKEDPERRGEGGANPRAALIETLVKDSICLSNGPEVSGFIVVGVQGKVPGLAAFLGADLDPDDAVKRIYDRTIPNLRVDAFAETVFGVRLLFIRVPEALAFHSRKDGRAWAREGAQCRSVAEEERQALKLARANPDYTNRLGSAAVEDVPLEVIEELRRLLKLKPRGEELTRGWGTTHGLLRELGLIDPESRLRIAAELLLLPPETGGIRIRHFWRSIPGAELKVTDFDGPIITALPALKRLILESSVTEVTRVQFDDGQEFAIERFPAEAVDEVVTNAALHRDWRLNSPIIVEQSPTILKVTSPGPLPHGVTVGTLLTTESVSRNNRLMSVVRMLGLAEESSRGFDRMWASMLRTGREVPEVIEHPHSLQVILAAGNPDVEFVKALHALERVFPGMVLTSVSTLIVLWHLWQSPLITLEGVCSKTQSPRLEAMALMEVLVDAGLLQRVREAPEWVLSDTARKIMGRGAAAGFSAVTVEDWIREKLQEGLSLSTAEVAEELGVLRPEVTGILRHLRSTGRATIDPNGPRRGPGVRWIGL